MRELELMSKHLMKTESSALNAREHRMAAGLPADAIGQHAAATGGLHVVPVASCSGTLLHERIRTSEATRALNLVAKIAGSTA